MPMYFSRSVDFARRCSSSSATCSSMVRWAAGSRPRRRRARRSSGVNASPLLLSDSRINAGPRRTVFAVRMFSERSIGSPFTAITGRTTAAARAERRGPEREAPKALVVSWALGSEAPGYSASYSQLPAPPIRAAAPLAGGRSRGAAG